ncbi:hypothetical protein NFI96_025742, partial [Prochilodus magdalenae]
KEHKGIVRNVPHYPYNWIAAMHKAYQPLKPATNKYLQKKWDQTHYETHRKKCQKIIVVSDQQYQHGIHDLCGMVLFSHEVKEAKPIVDTKGIRTPTHVQTKLKKAQVQEERQAIIDRDNQMLASRLAGIEHSKGLIDHRNEYSERSLNAERRREKLTQVTRENLAIYQRITARESEYRREVWEEDWEKVERRRDDIARYPRGVANKQRSKKSVKFSGGTLEQSQSSSSRTEDDHDETTEED